MASLFRPLLLGTLASVQAGCTIASGCGEDGESCVRLEGGETGEGRAALTCAFEGKEPERFDRALTVATACTFGDEGLFVQVGSSTCDYLAVRISDFVGPGTYQVRPDGPSRVDVHVVRPSHRCEDWLPAQSAPIAACDAAPEPCAIEVTGDVTPTRGGDLRMRITCGTLASVSGGSCGSCRAEGPFSLSIRGCDLAE